jgi:small subunit ribosomal protein S6
MKNYELTYLITPLLSEEEARAFQEKIISSIQDQGGILTEGGILVRKRLAYPVKKNLQAFLAVLSFQLSPEKTADLEKKIKAEGEILRHLLVIKEPLKEKFLRPRRTIRVPEPALKAKEPATSKEKKVELKEIDKKLDEILKE